MLRQECYSIDDVIFFEGDNEDKFIDIEDSDLEYRSQNKSKKKHKNF